MQTPRFTAPPKRAPIAPEVLRQQFIDITKRFHGLSGFGDPEDSENALRWSTRDGANVADELPNPENFKLAERYVTQMRLVAPDLAYHIENIGEWTDLEVRCEERDHPLIVTPVTPELGAAMAAWLQSLLEPKSRVEFKGYTTGSATYLVWPGGGIMDSEAHGGYMHRRTYSQRLREIVSKHPDCTGKIDTRFVDGNRHEFQIADRLHEVALMD